MIKDCEDCGEPFYTATGGQRWCPQHRKRAHLNVRHGTVNAYSNYNCRCDLCKQAFAVYMKDYRARHATAQAPPQQEAG